MEEGECCIIYHLKFSYRFWRKSCKVLTAWGPASSPQSVLSNKYGSTGNKVTRSCSYSLAFIYWRNLENKFLAAIKISYILISWTTVRFSRRICPLFIPWLLRLVADLSPRQPRFNIRSALVVFIVDKEIGRMVLSLISWVSPAIIASTKTPYS